MKLSTKLFKNGGIWVCSNNDIIMQKIVFFVDFDFRNSTHSLSEADRINRDLLEHGCRLMVDECPVYNSKNEIILHYASATNKDWNEKGKYIKRKIERAKVKC